MISRRIILGMIASGLPVLWPYFVGPAQAMMLSRWKDKAKLSPRLAAHIPEMGILATTSGLVSPTAWASLNFFSKEMRASRGQVNKSLDELLSYAEHKKILSEQDAKVIEDLARTTQNTPYIFDPGKDLITADAQHGIWISLPDISRLVYQILPSGPFKKGPAANLHAAMMRAAFMQ